MCLTWRINVLIYLVRHALPDFKTGVPYHTVPGPPLTEAGIEQAAAAAKLLERTDIARVVSSPMRRSTMTAEPICAQLGLDLQVDDDLGEAQPGETPAAIGLRMLRATLRQCDVPAVALVSHASPIEQLLLALTNGQVLLPAADGRGARVGIAHVWQVMLRAGTWHAHYLPLGGVWA
jgi:broad specificity phosphatase PhoE